MGDCHVIIALNITLCYSRLYYQYNNVIILTRGSLV